MPKSKWNLNTIYISERLQESLRPISRCAMTTVVAPMGYGKTTAVEWYLANVPEPKRRTLCASVYYGQSCNFLEKSVQDAFARAGFCLSAGVRLSDRRSQRRTADRRSVSFADR